MGSQQIGEITRKYDKKPGGLISILEEIQGKYGYLPQNLIEDVAEQTGKSLVDIYGVATFYKAFRLNPIGDHLITVCLGTACHVRNSPEIVEEFKKELGISVGETTPNNEFTLETINCLGSCALGPIVVIDGRYFSRVKKSLVPKLIKMTRDGLDTIDVLNDKRVFPLKLRCPRCNHSLMDSKHPIDEHASVKVTVSFGRKHGWLRLSSMYGSYHIESEYDIHNGTVVNCFCPHCHGALTDTSMCPECGAPMIAMLVRGGNMVQVCSRHGCKGHMLEVNNIMFEKHP